MQRTGIVGAFLEGFGLEGVKLVPDGHCLSLLDGQVCGVSTEAGDIGLEHIAVHGIALFLVLGRYAPGDLEAGVDELDFVFRALEHRLAVYLHQLVHISKARGGLGSGDGVAYAVTVYPGALALQVRDKILVQAVGRKDFTLGKAVGIQDAAHFLREVRQVSAVQTDAVTGGITVVNAVFLEGTDGVLDAAAQGVIRIDQQDDIFSPVCVDVVRKCLMLTFYGAAIGSDEAVRHGAG